MNNQVALFVRSQKKKDQLQTFHFYYEAIEKGLLNPNFILSLPIKKDRWWEYNLA
jgi:hypothetical protein